MAWCVAAAPLPARGHWSQILLLALLAVLLPDGALCVREGGSLDQQHLGASDQLWQPPGTGMFADFLEKNGRSGAATTVRESGTAVACCVGGALILIILCLVMVYRRGSSGSVGTAGTVAEAGRPVDASGEEAALPQQLTRLKREKTRMVMEQAMQKQKLERLIESILRLEAELKQAQGEPPPSPEEIQKKAQDAIAATEMLTDRSLTSAMAYIAPLVMQGNRVYETLERRRHAMQERAAKMAFEEAQVACKELGDVFGVDAELRSNIFDTVAHVEIPSIATLISSAFAPGKLRFAATNLQIGVAVHALCVLIAVIVLLVDRHSPCGSHEKEHDNFIFYWYSTDLAVGVTCLLIRGCSLARINRVIDRIDTPPATSDDPAKAFRILMDYYMTVGAMALEKYDEFARSSLNTFANWSVVFGLIWMCYATHLVFNYPWIYCVTAGLVILRVRVVLFLVCLGPILINLVIFFAGRYFDSDSFQTTLLSAADSIDQVVGLGMPIAGVVVQSLLVRSPRDLTSLQLRRAELQKYELQCKKDEAEATLTQVEYEKASLDAEIERLEAQRDEEAVMTDDELRVKHIAAKDKILDDAQQVFIKLTGKAAELTKQAEEQIKKWEAEGGIPIQDLLDSGLSVSQVQDYMAQARKQAEESMQKLTEDQRFQQAMSQVKETAQSAAAAAQKRAKDLPSLEQVQQQASVALAQGSTAAAQCSAAPPAPSPEAAEPGKS